MELNKAQYAYIGRLTNVGVPLEIAVIAAERADGRCPGGLRQALTFTQDFDLIQSTFLWEDTPEGHRLWWGVNDCLCDLVRNPE